MPLSFNDVQYVVKELAQNALPGYNFGWPNQAYSGPRPYTNVDVVFTGVSDETMAQTSRTAEGYVSFVIVVDTDTSTESAYAIADALAVPFRSALRLTRNDTTVTFVTPLEVPSSGYDSGADYRLPLTIRFYATGIGG